MFLVNNYDGRADCESFDRDLAFIMVRLMREVIYDDAFCVKNIDCNEKERNMIEKKNRRKAALIFARLQTTTCMFSDQCTVKKNLVSHERSLDR